MIVEAPGLSSLLRNSTAALVTAAAGVAALGLGLGYRYLRRPERAVRVGVVSKLLIHPLKSGKALRVELAEVHELGLKYGELRDRQWLVITAGGHMVTGRQEPRLVLVSLSCEEGQVCLSGPNVEDLYFPIPQPDNPVVNCRIFKEDVQGRDCGDDASNWLTYYLGAEKTFRLVHFELQMKTRKPLEEEQIFPQFEVAYPDVAPVMLLSESSVKDLSSRVESDLTVERFRPNIVINDCEAFQEDSWQEIQIGNVRLQRVMSCGRCIFTTVDPKTGIINRKEPLETLRSYRLCDPSEKHIYQASPLFGQLHKVKQAGVVHVGDVVYQISR